MEQFKTRKPVVAGQFYPASPEKLKNQISAFIDKKAARHKQAALACVLPHAGYEYSGSVAAETLSAVAIPDKIILLGPNHTGFGAKFSLMGEGVWQTPLGDVKIDAELAKKILRRSSHLKQDYLAHLQEHSLEVVLPFLQFFKRDFEIVPITVFPEDISVLKKIGQELAEAIKEGEIKGSVLLVASSDLTHYESAASAQKKDHAAIEAILKLDADLLAQRVGGLNISMCGYAPVIIMLVAARELGASSGRLIKYQTSGEATGDFDSVVGYAGIVIN